MEADARDRCGMTGRSDGIARRDCRSGCGTRGGTAFTTAFLGEATLVLALAASLLPTATTAATAASPPVAAAAGTH